MLQPVYTRLFKKDVERSIKRGNDPEKLKVIIELLLREKPLPVKLKGEFKDYWECHIEPDWLLVYKKTVTEIILVRVGSHSDLF